MSYIPHNPVKPSEFKSLIPDEKDNVFSSLLKFYKFIVLYYKWYNYMFDENNNITAEAQEDICEAYNNYGGCKSNANTSQL